MQTLKGKTRRIRKALRKAGYRGFPIVGAFHVTINGKPIRTEDIKPGLKLTYTPGPAPEYVAPMEPALTLTVPADLPALPKLYKKVEKISATTGKKRTEYKEVANPKSGETYWMKPEGKTRYVEVNYSKLLADLDNLAEAA